MSVRAIWKQVVGVAAVGVVAASAVMAQGTKPSADLAGIAHVAVRVKSLDASVAFYEKLGFVKAFALSKDGAVYEAFIKIGDRQFIELYPATEKDPQIGFLHLCFEGGDLNAVHDYYVAQGLKPNAVRTAGAGNLLFTMPGPMTPQGPQNMEYTQYMPGSLHSKDFGQHLGAERIGDKLTVVTLAVNDLPASRAFYLDKAGFKATSGNVMGLPGGSNEAVELASETQGFKAVITLQVADVAKAGAELTKRGVAFAKEPKDLVVLDPDGNEIYLKK